MTEKRFKYTFKGIEDTLESDEECKYTLCNKDGFQDLCVMLNDLHDENEQLKTLVDFYKDFQKDARELSKENEELKSELKIYRKIASCSNCDYHNYNWFDDGDEFEVCDKGNDMSDYICEDWREL